MHTADANSLGNNRFVALLLALVLTSANARAADPSPATPTRPIRTLGTVEEFSPVTARYVRMTILKTAADIFPILNEVEIYAAESAPRNVALAANGGKASALATRDATWSVENLNDDRSTGWWAGQPGTNNWVQIEFPKPEVINRIVWSRSRAEPQRTVGIWSGTPTDYRFEVAVEPGQWRLVASSRDHPPFVSLEEFQLGVDLADSIPEGPILQPLANPLVELQTTNSLRTPPTYRVDHWGGGHRSPPGHDQGYRADAGRVFVDWDGPRSGPLRR